MFGIWTGLYIYTCLVDWQIYIALNGSPTTTHNKETTGSFQSKNIGWMRCTSVSSIPLLWYGMIYVVGSVLLIVLVFCGVFFGLIVFVLCLVYSMLLVSLHCPFFIASCVFSNDYLHVTFRHRKCHFTRYNIANYVISLTKCRLSLSA